MIYRWNHMKFQQFKFHISNKILVYFMCEIEPWHKTATIIAMRTMNTRQSQSRARTHNVIEWMLYAWCLIFCSVWVLVFFVFCGFQVRGNVLCANGQVQNCVCFEICLAFYLNILEYAQRIIANDAEKKTVWELKSSVNKCAIPYQKMVQKRFKLWNEWIKHWKNSIKKSTEKNNEKQNAKHEQKK